MQELEKILEEMQKIKDIMLSPANMDCFGEPCKENDCLVCVLNKCMEIVKNHINDGWIPVDRELPPNAKHKGAFCPKYQVMTKYGVTEGWYNPDAEGWYVLIWFMTDRYLESEIDFDKGDNPKIVFLTDEVNSKRNILTAWKEMELYHPERSDNHDGEGSNKNI